MKARTRFVLLPMRRSASATAAAAFPILALVLVSCGGPRTVSRDGYRAKVVYSAYRDAQGNSTSQQPSPETYSIAVRGEWKRADGFADGVPQVKIERPDLEKTWLFRTDTKRLFEQAWSPENGIVPGYPLDPLFDSQAYASRFQAQIRKVPDEAFAGHPCDRYEMDPPNGGRVQMWAARDLERLVIRVLQEKKKSEEEFEPILDVRLAEIRIGADPDLFQKPKGYRSVASAEALKAR